MLPDALSPFEQDLNDFSLRPVSITLNAAQWEYVKGRCQEGERTCLAIFNREHLSTYERAVIQAALMSVTEIIGKIDQELKR